MLGVRAPAHWFDARTGRMACRESSTVDFAFGIARKKHRRDRLFYSAAPSVQAA
jgi:hypothetical protein